MSIPMAAAPVRLERVFEGGDVVDVVFSRKSSSEIELNFWEGFWQVLRGDAPGKFFFVTTAGVISGFSDSPRELLSMAVKTFSTPIPKTH